MNPELWSMLAALTTALVTGVFSVLAVIVQSRRTKRVEDTVQTLKPEGGDSIADKVRHSSDLTEHILERLEDLHGSVRAMTSRIDDNSRRIDDSARRLDNHIDQAQKDRERIFTAIGSQPYGRQRSEDR